MIETIRNVMFKRENNNIFSPILKIAYYVGLWPDDSASTWKKGIYFLYEHFIDATMYLLDMLSFLGIYGLRDDPLKMVESLNKCQVTYHATMKSILFIIIRRSLKALLDEMKNSGDVLTKTSERAMIKMFFLVYGPSTILTFAFTVVSTIQGEAVIDIWTPMNGTMDKMTTLYVNQFIAALFLPAMYRLFFVEVLFGCIIIYLCDQIMDLQNRLKNLEYSTENDAEVRNEFKSIVKKHCRIILYVQKTSNYWKYVLFVQNTTVTIEMCLSAFMISKIGTSDKVRLINFIVFLIVSLTNSYIYCYLGNELISKSEGLSSAAYNSSWLSWPADLQKDLLMMLRCAQRPLEITAYTSVMSLTTYSKIVYNGYSVFAMLYDIIN